MQSDVDPLGTLFPPGPMTRVAIDGHLLRVPRVRGRTRSTVGRLARRTVVRLRAVLPRASYLAIAPRSGVKYAS